jgi:tetratricopeptide (TPR) repeat protein
MKRRHERGGQEQRQRGESVAAAAPADRMPPWFWQGLLGISIFCLLRGTLFLAISWKANPFAAALLEDALVYWNWAGEVAAGHVVGETPFLSPPLYPYLLGLIRALGGGLPTVFGVQLLLYVTTIVLIGWIAAGRFGSRVGLLGAAFFALLTDPMFFTGRVLNCTLQVFLVCVLWWRLIAAQARPALRSWVIVGLLAGLNCLANPPMLLLLVLLGPWAYSQGRRGRRGAVHSALAVVAGFVVISPATLHNYVVTREFIPLTAESGLTFYHGNNPGAPGTYWAVPGISIHRSQQHADAERLYQQAMRRPGNWNEVSSFCRGKGLEFWAANPGLALSLLAHKLYWFLTSRNYGDIYLPTLEMEAGFAGWLRTAPLPVAWLIPPALVAMVVLICRPIRYGPEIMLFGLPVLTVLLFMFNSRYRLPAVPVIAVAAAWACCQAWQWRLHFRWSVAVAGSVVLAVALTAVNDACNFDTLNLYRTQFGNSAGLAFTQAGKPDQAIEWFRKTLATNAAFTLARSNLIRALQHFGRDEEALTELRLAVELAPGDASIRNDLGTALARRGATDEAILHFQEAVRIQPGSAEYHNGLANALFEKGRLDEAMQHYQAALQADPTVAATHTNIGMLYAKANQPDQAMNHFAEAVRLDPTQWKACYQAALVQLNRGRIREGLEAMRRAHETAPDNTSVADALAWLLATAPAEFRDSATAVALARKAIERTRGQDPNVLDTLAAALAAGAQFEEAARIAQDALNLAVQQNVPDLEAGIRQRLELYKTGRPYTGSFTPRPD